MAYIGYMRDEPPGSRTTKMKLTPAAKKMLRELGRIGGKTRAENLTAAERRSIARKASKAAAEARMKKAQERQRGAK